jgi:hypothetical protein
MLHRKHRGKIVTCYEYGMLTQVRGLVEAEEETWKFESNTNEDLMVNYSLFQALDNLSMEGWDLVIKHELGFILRKQIKRHVPEPSL